MLGRKDLRNQWRLCRGVDLVEMPGCCGLLHEGGDARVERAFEHLIGDPIETALVCERWPFVQDRERAEVDLGVSNRCVPHHSLAQKRTPARQSCVPGLTPSLHLNAIAPLTRRPRNGS